MFRVYILYDGIDSCFRTIAWTDESIHATRDFPFGD